MAENQDISTINNRGSTKADGKKYCRDNKINSIKLHSDQEKL